MEGDLVDSRDAQLKHHLGAAEGFFGLLGEPDSYEASFRYKEQSVALDSSTSIKTGWYLGAS